MTNPNIFRHCSAPCALAVACLSFFAVAGCVVEPVGGHAYVAAPVVVAAPPVVVESDLVYYPSYEVYYDPGARVYWHPQSGVWVAGPAPIGISVDVLLASPSVHTGFRDSPQNHHAEVARQYPRNWRPNGHDPVGPGGPDGPGGPGGPGGRGRRG